MIIAAKKIERKLGKERDQLSLLVFFFFVPDYSVACSCGVKSRSTKHSFRWAGVSHRHCLHAGNTNKQCEPTAQQMQSPPPKGQMSL